MANQSIYAAFERMWAHLVNIVHGKAESSHTHKTSDITDSPVTVENNVITFSNGLTITYNDETGEITFSK